MAELTPRERLQPSLLDRLIDLAPDQAIEPREQRVLCMAGLRRAVLRDLTWLLNASRLFPRAQPGLPRHVHDSVLNYGIPDISGVSADGLDLAGLEQGIRQAIWDFEPRLLRNSVSVSAVASAADASNTILFDICAELWGQPFPEHLYLKTELDLERGTVHLIERS
ncbi:type VI secretion system baseplate subunit TssE [Massilia sp. P8910]|uniref:type VI secretion system baseplate subunit TssE n=1 Tax=Massilia antarctica TaxID=2765360 RepID=UPI001E55A53E|nr:type VI secretion system baseplate subunit TssE [Massilia antarctica]MCE3607894.1 type VI secretion system baseplate subunit TssE [Massilia antarctica]